MAGAGACAVLGYGVPHVFTADAWELAGVESLNTITRRTHWVPRQGRGGGGGFVCVPLPCALAETADSGV